jgi:hypothetical protein
VKSEKKNRVYSQCCILQAWKISIWNAMYLYNNKSENNYGSK